MRQRLARDESGMAMALAVIMVALLSAMGAGLLVFATTDLGIVIESNQGQKAFEMADAGVKAAKRQLDRESTSGKYNGNAGSGDPTDVRWSYCFGVIPATCSGAGYISTGGVTLSNLYPSTTTNRANVTIQSLPADTFKVVSTGEYGPAKRRIEAVFSKKPGGSGVPGYYTPGDIIFRRPIGPIPHDELKIQGLSFFSGRNIMIEHYDGLNLTGGDGKTHDATHFKPGNDGDRLGDWNSTDTTTPYFSQVGASTYNTVGRKKADGKKYEGTGFAAEGYVCKGLTCPDPGSSTSTDPKIVSDGILSYDRTTGTKGKNLKFMAKNPPDKNPNGTDGGTPARNVISYPFPRPTPDAEYLKSLADDGTGPNALFTSPPTLSQWQSAYPAPTAATSTASAFRVVFIDLENSVNKDIVFGQATEGNANRINPGSDHGANRAFGIMVVRCGNLKMNEHFDGIAILMKGTGAGCESAGRYTNSGADTHIGGYVYAEGDRDASGNPAAGIDIAEHVHLETLPDNFKVKDTINETNYATRLFDLAYSGNASAGVEMQSWREVYN